MGLISLPIMLRYGYDRRIASGTIAASGTLAQIIPPSLVLIIMADQLGRSVGDMYAGAFIPGLVLAGLYALFILITSFVKPAWVPALPEEARTFREPDGSSGTARWRPHAARRRRRRRVLVPLLQSLPARGYDRRAHRALRERRGGRRLLRLGHQSRDQDGAAVADRRTGDIRADSTARLIFLVLGTIFLGVATPTEGGAMGATGALIMAVARRRLTCKLLKQAMDSTAKLTAFVVFILVGARVFSLTFYGVDGHMWVEHLLSDLPGGCSAS